MSDDTYPCNECDKPAAYAMLGLGSSAMYPCAPNGDISHLATPLWQEPFHEEVGDLIYLCAQHAAWFSKDGEKTP
jgi:hypothetical protein